MSLTIDDMFPPTLRHSVLLPTQWAVHFSHPLGSFTQRVLHQDVSSQEEFGIEVQTLRMIVNEDLKTLLQLKDECFVEHIPSILSFLGAFFAAEKSSMPLKESISSIQIPTAVLADVFQHQLGTELRRHAFLLFDRIVSFRDLTATRHALHHTDLCRPMIHMTSVFASSTEILDLLRQHANWLLSPLTASTASFLQSIHDLLPHLDASIHSMLFVYEAVHALSLLFFTLCPSLLLGALTPTLIPCLVTLYQDTLPLLYHQPSPQSTPPHLLCSKLYSSTRHTLLSIVYTLIVVPSDNKNDIKPDSKWPPSLKATLLRSPTLLSSPKDSTPSMIAVLSHLLLTSSHANTAVTCFKYTQCSLLLDLQRKYKLSTFLETRSEEVCQLTRNFVLRQSKNPTEDLSELRLAATTSPDAYRQIQSLFPDYSRDFIAALLAAYQQRADAAIKALLENRLDQRLASLPRTTYVKKDVPFVPKKKINKERPLDRGTIQMSRDEQIDIKRLVHERLCRMALEEEEEGEEEEEEEEKRERDNQRKEDKEHEDDQMDQNDLPSKASVSPLFYSVAVEEKLKEALNSQEKLFERANRGAPRDALRRATELTDEQIEGWYSMVKRDPRRWRQLHETQRIVQPEIVSAPDAPSRPRGDPRYRQQHRIRGADRKRAVG